MESAIVSGLLVALVTGITILAYKHPTAFNRLYLPLCLSVLAISMGVGAWNGAISETLAVLKNFISPDSFSAATEKAQALKFAPWLSWASFVVVMYLLFLLFLPDLLKEDKKEQKPKDE